MPGVNLNADYPGRAECEAHWERIRARLRANQPIIEPSPMPTLQKQAERQIRRLQRELAEWRAIAAKSNGEPQ